MMPRHLASRAAMNLDSVDTSPVVGHDTTRTVSKLLLSAGSLAFVAYLVTLLPGADRLVPATPVSFVAVVGAIATVVIAALLLLAAPRIAYLTRRSLEGPVALVDHVASAACWIVVLAAVLVAHSGLAGLVVPLPDGVAWLYDVAFLLLALPPVAFVAIHLYQGLDPGAELLADRLAAAGTDETPAGVAENSAGAAETSAGASTQEDTPVAAETSTFDAGAADDTPTADATADDSPSDDTGPSVHESTDE